MKQPTPTPGAPETLAVRAMFDRVAPRYDVLNRLLSLGTDVRWRRRAVAELGSGDGIRVLDVCTGTGDLLVEALRGWPSRTAVGVDLSGAMLVRAAEKLVRRGLSDRARLVRGDAERLPLGDGEFDAAVVGFGLRNVGDRAAAVRELARVLRPGGRLVVLEFGAPGGLVGRLYNLYFHRVLPLVAGMLSERSAYTYLPRSVARFPSPEAFAATLREAGFASVGTRALSAGIAWLYTAALG